MSWTFEQKGTALTLACMFLPVVLLVVAVLCGLPCPLDRDDWKRMPRFEVVDPPGVVEMSINRYGLLGWSRFARLKMEDGTTRIVPVRDIRIRLVEE